MRLSNDADGPYDRVVCCSLSGVRKMSTLTQSTSNPWLDGGAPFTVSCTVSECVSFFKFPPWGRLSFSWGGYLQLIGVHGALSGTLR